MGFRFRKYFGVLPGVRVNVGKRRVSVSIGERGLTANISKDGIRKTISAPGTGLSYSNYQKHSELNNTIKNVSPFSFYVVIFLIVGSAAVGVVVIIALLK